MSDSFGAPWTAARQAPLSMGLPRQEHWTGCHFLLQGTFPPRRRNHVSCASCAGRWALHHCVPWEAPTTGRPGKSLDVCAGIPKAVGLLDGDSLWKLKMNILRHPLPDTRPPHPLVFLFCFLEVLPCSADVITVEQ